MRCAPARLGRALLYGSALAMLFAAPPPASALSITFTKIADTSTSIPGGSGSFISFGRNPSIDGNDVAFRGEGDPPIPLDPQQQGIYSTRSGSLALVADQDTAIPGGAGNFETFTFKPSSDGGRVAWSGDGSASQEGVYRDDGAGALLVADRATLLPGGQTGELFDSFVLPPVMSGGDVVFHAEGDGGVSGPSTHGLYTDAGGSLAPIVDSLDTLPGSSETFDFISLADSDAGAVAFRAIGSGGTRGVYLVDGVLTTVADDTTTVPGGGATFSSFGGEPTLSDGTVLFLGTDTGGVTGLYTADTSITLVADENTAIPGAGGSTFNIFGNYAIDADVVVFEGIGTPGSEIGLYTDFGGVLQKIIDLTDPLDGKTLSELEISKEGLSGNHLVFWARFTDGSEGVFVANIPEPGSAGLVALGLAGLGAFRRIRCR